VIRVGESYPLTRNELAEQLEDRGAEISVHWDPPLHEHQVFRSLASDVSLPASERLADELLTLPMHPALSSSDVEYVADIIEEFA
jgi:dTDP-4-amino-4,6-dideoxygalactose transaminase